MMTIAFTIFAVGSDRRCTLLSFDFHHHRRAGPIRG
jgi:hypothetical protein